MSKLALEPRKPKLDSWAYSSRFPDRYHVVRMLHGNYEETPWMVWRGLDWAAGFATFDEAVNWALRAAWGVEVIGR